MYNNHLKLLFFYLFFSLSFMSSDLYGESAVTPKNVTVTFLHDSFQLMAGTRDILVAQVEPASEAANIRFIPARYRDGTYEPFLNQSILIAAEFEADSSQAGTRFVLLEAGVLQESVHLYLVAISSSGQKLATIPIEIKTACPYPRFYVGGEYVEEKCGIDHVHELGQITATHSDNLKHLYNDSHSFKVGDPGYLEHNENVCQYCLGDEWFWWKAIGALRGAYNSPGFSPVNPFTSLLGEEWGTSVEATIVPTLNWTSENIFIPVLTVVGMPFRYLEDRLVGLGLSRTDIEAIYLHLMVGAVRLPSFRPLATYTKVALAQNVARANKAIEVFKNKTLLELPGFELVPNLSPVLVTPEGIAIGSELFQFNQLSMAMSRLGKMAEDVGYGIASGSVATFEIGKKGLGYAVKPLNFFTLRMNSMAYLYNMTKQFKWLLDMKRQGVKVKGFGLIPLLKRDPLNPIIWYPVFIGTTALTGADSVTEWVVESFVLDENSMPTLSDLNQMVEEKLPELGENEVVVIVDATNNSREALRVEIDVLERAYPSEKIIWVPFDGSWRLWELVERLEGEGKFIKVLDWIGHGSSSELGFGGMFSASLAPEINHHNFVEYFSPLRRVLREDALWYFSSCGVASGAEGKCFSQTLHDTFIPRGTLIMPTEILRVRPVELEGPKNPGELYRNVPGLIELSHMVEYYSILTNLSGEHPQIIIVPPRD